MSEPVLIVDVREENELLESKIVPVAENVQVVNIPARHIFANLDWLRSQPGTVWLICRSGARSGALKTKYFPEDVNIKSSAGGVGEFMLENKTNDGENEHINPQTVEIIQGKGGFGIQQYLQLAFATMLLVVALLNTILPKVQLNYVIYAMICVILYQIYTKSCWLGKMVPKATFEPIEIKEKITNK